MCCMQEVQNLKLQNYHLHISALLQFSQWETQWMQEACIVAIKDALSWFKKQRRKKKAEICFAITDKA